MNSYENKFTVVSDIHLKKFKSFWVVVIITDGMNSYENKRLERLLRFDVLIDILVNPDKYKESIDVDKIVADLKVDLEGVEREKNKIAAGEDVGTIVVVRHPSKKLYAVLDGHHRYWGKKLATDEQEPSIQMNCAVIPDYFGLLFYLTKEGVFQPPSEFTRYVRIPLLRLQNYLNEFLRNPEKMLEEMTKGFRDN